MVGNDVGFLYSTLEKDLCVESETSGSQGRVGMQKGIDFLPKESGKSRNVTKPI
jgi:hypothetical protein